MNIKPQGFHSQFLRLAIVNILSNLMVPLAGLMDVAFLGHLVEIRHLAGVALATIVFNYIYWTFGFLRMGTTGTAAQAMGRGDRQEITAIGLRNTALALILGLAIGALQYPIREVGFALLSATPEVKASGIAYYNAMIWGAPPTLVNFVLIGWFLGKGQGGKVLLLSLVGNGANIGLDYLFIMQLGWESAGAGWGTALSQYGMLLVGVLLVSSEIQIGNVKTLLPQVFDPVTLKATFSLSGDIVIRTFALVTTFALFTNLGSALGTLILATNTLLLQVTTLAAYFIDGVAFATESFAGIFRGCGEGNRLLPLVKLSGGISLGLGLAFALVFISLPNQLFSLLTSHTNVVDRTSHYVLWLLPVLGFGSLAYMLDGYFLGLTEGRILRTSSLIATLIGFIPIAFTAWQLQSNHILWLALTSFMAARVITLATQIPKTIRGISPSLPKHNGGD